MEHVDLSDERNRKKTKTSDYNLSHLGDDYYRLCLAPHSSEEREMELSELAFTILPIYLSDGIEPILVQDLQLKKSLFPIVYGSDMRKALSRYIAHSTPDSIASFTRRMNRADRRSLLYKLCKENPEKQENIFKTQILLSGEHEALNGDSRINLLRQYLSDAFYLLSCFMTRREGCILLKDNILFKVCNNRWAINHDGWAKEGDWTNEAMDLPFNDTYVDVLEAVNILLRYWIDHPKEKFIFGYFDYSIANPLEFPQVKTRREWIFPGLKSFPKSESFLLETQTVEEICRSKNGITKSSSL